MANALLEAEQKFRAGRLSDAADLYQRILAAQPEHAEALCGLGKIASLSGRAAEAVRLLEKAIALQPNNTVFHFQLGTALHRDGSLERAVECYYNAVRLSPGNAAAVYNLGLAQYHLHNLSEAERIMRQALAMLPDDVDVLIGLANILQEQRQLQPAAEFYQRALSINPSSSEAHNNLGNLFKGARQLPEAKACYQRAVKAKPENILAWGNLAAVMRQACDWQALDQVTEHVLQLESQSTEKTISPYGILSLPSSPEQQFQCATKWFRKHRVPAGRRFRHTPTVNPNARRLKLGYLSGDFRAHAISYSIADMLKQHDRQQFEVIGYSYGPNDNSEIRQQIVTNLDQFNELTQLDSQAAAEKIYSDQIDILIDLTGYTRDGRPDILARRPAPIQVNYLGYAGTLGQGEWDYCLVDEFVVPPSQQSNFGEKLVYLPGCYYANQTSRKVAAAQNSRQDHGLPDEGFVFCSFNRSEKITPEVFACWMRLLTGLPGSVLWLLVFDPQARANIRREAERHHVSPQRIVFADRMRSEDHLARHKLADLFLDTFPYTAHTTACDALWVGLPLVTQCGDTFASRVAGSILQAVGLPELITQNQSDYESLAIDLATQPERLRQIRDRLSANRDNCQLFDTARFTRGVEAAYQAMWSRWQRGASPELIRISDASSRC